MTKRHRLLEDDTKSKKQKTIQSGQVIENGNQERNSETLDVERSESPNKDANLTLDTAGITKQQRSELLREKRKEIRKAKKEKKKAAKLEKEERAREMRKLTKNTDKYDKEKRKQNKKKLKKQQETQHIPHKPAFQQPNTNSNYARIQRLMDKAAEVIHVLLI